MADYMGRGDRNSQRRVFKISFRLGTQGRLPRQRNKSYCNSYTLFKNKKENERKNKEPVASLDIPEAEEPRAMVVVVHHRSDLCDLFIHRVFLNHHAAMKKATSIQQWQEEFRLLLSTEIVTFYYRKKNGKLRKAVGTTCLDLVPTDFLPKGIGAPVRPAGYVNYYDFTVCGWRTVRLQHVTSYVLPEGRS